MVLTSDFEPSTGRHLAQGVGGLDTVHASLVFADVLHDQSIHVVLQLLIDDALRRHQQLVSTEPVIVNGTNSSQEKGFPMLACDKV